MIEEWRFSASFSREIELLIQFHLFEREMCIRFVAILTDHMTDLKQLKGNDLCHTIKRRKLAPAGHQDEMHPGKKEMVSRYSLLY